MELEIKSKKIDYHYSEFRMLLIAYICVYFMSPIFIFFIKSDIKHYYILLINAVFVMIFYIFVVILQIFFKLLIKLKRKKIIFSENYLEIFFGTESKKIEYDKIEMIFLRKNLLNSADIIINFPTNNTSLFNRQEELFKGDKNSIVISNVINYEEIFKELKQRLFFFESKNEKVLEYKSFIENKIVIIFLILLFYFFYKIKISICLIIMLFVKIKRYNYKINYLNNDQIKIFNANKEIYIKNNNYFFDKDDLKLKIKNVDRILLSSNSVFLPMHYKIKIDSDV
ncbi:hypothetical protein JCM16777_0016 [Leptotrichia wadei]|uniref:Uncharacterized protein n=1 Tax=Leptotrichia wadei TaxID=157687 RepID=A0A7U6L8K6_9FUSO|nr:hypothetical protein JCM16777_0016 [Leptotrichia wadei]